MERAFWDERYSAGDLVYGEAPNDFLALMAPRLPTRGSALDLGAGEGRNAIFLASLGLDVLAVDQSDVGLAKARARAPALRTRAADLREFDAAPASFDVVTSIFVHLPAPLRALVHARVRRWLRPGGVFLLEAYGPDQIARDTGGPRDPERLAPLATIVRELDGLAIEHGVETVRRVVEGRFHGGDASVVQVLARMVR